MTDNEITMTSAEFKPPKKRKAIYPHIVVGGKVDDPYYSIHWYDVEERRMIEGYSSFSLKYVREWLEECFEVVEDDIEPLINRQKAEIEELKSKNSNLTSDLTSLQNDLTSAKAEIEMDDVEIKELRIALQGYLDDVTRVRNLYKKSIEELNQANAEIERLKTNLNIELENYATEYDNKIKAEAYREFAERLHCYCEGVINQEWNSKVAPISWAIAYGEFEDVVDYHLKELVGEDDG